MSAEKPRRLGRGLEALIGTSSTAAPSASELQRIAVAKVRPNPYQPRQEFTPGELEELESSIRSNGLLQPITVRKKGEFFELVAGERRLRAVSNLGWREIPAMVRDYDDQALLVLALVENLQRSDLNPMEEARGFQRLLNEFSLTHQQVAEGVGKDRSTVTNLLRLLQLPAPVQEALEAGRLSTGHARAMLALEDDAAIVALANEVIAKELSVRDTERRVRQARSSAPVQPARLSPTAAAGGGRVPGAARVEEELRRYLQTDVQLELSSADKGSIRIAFYSPDDLERVLDLVIGEERNRD